MSEDGWVELSDAIGVVREQLIAAQTVRRHTVAGEGENVEHDAGGWQRGGRLLGSCLAEVQATLQRREVDPSLIPEDELSIEHHFDIGADADEPCSVALPVTLVGRVEVESTCALTPGTRHAADRARRQGSEGHVSRARGGAGRRRGDSRGVAGRPAAERRPAAESSA